MKLYYCVVNENWYDEKVSSFTEAFSYIKSYLSEGKNIQIFSITTNNENLQFIIENGKFILHDYKPYIFFDDIMSE